MPSHFAGLGKYNPDLPELDIVNEHLAILPDLVAEQHTIIEEYRRELAAQPRPGRQRPTPDQLLQMLAALPTPSVPPVAPNKPKKS